jgi:hypothetical protein
MRFGSGEFNAASSVQQTSDGGYIIAGSSGVIGSSSVLVAKLSTAGGYIVGGEVVAESPEGTTPGEALLLKLSSAGAIRFQDVFNAGTALNFSSHGTSIRQTPDGGYIPAGSEGLSLSMAPRPLPPGWSRRPPPEPCPGSTSSTVPPISATSSRCG